MVGCGMSTLYARVTSYSSRQCVSVLDCDAARWRRRYNLLCANLPEVPRTPSSPSLSDASTVNTTSRDEEPSPRPRPPVFDVQYRIRVLMIPQK